MDVQNTLRVYKTKFGTAKIRNLVGNVKNE